MGESWPDVRLQTGRFTTGTALLDCNMSHISSQDIVEHIIGHPILQNEKQTLAACSLVCSSWVSSSRRHLFRDVLLARIDKVQSFIRLFASSKCTIGPHIRNVEINISGQSKAHTAAVCVAIQAVARFVPACHHLSISPFNWKDFPTSTRNTFLRLVNIKNPKFFDAECESPKKFHIIIGSFPQLLSLTLENNTFNRYVLPSIMPLPPSLTELSLSGSGFAPFHSSIARTVLPNLSRVDITLPPSSFADISRWMKQHASTLESVSIYAEKLPQWNVGSTFIDAWSLLDFSEFSTLKSLSFDFDPYRAGIDHFRVVATILHQIPSTSLTSLEVFCTADLHVHHRAALVILKNWVNTLNKPRFANMHNPRIYHAQITGRALIMSHAQIYCDSIDDFPGYWTKWIMNNLHDPHHVLDIQDI